MPQHHADSGALIPLITAGQTLVNKIDAPYARAMHIVPVLVAAVYGAVAGLLLPSAAYRLAVPAGQPRRTTCPEKHVLAGWRGPARCRSCAAHATGRRARDAPGVRTAAFAVTTGVLCGALAAAAPSAGAVAAVAVTPVLVLLGWIDHVVHRLPDVLTLPLAAAVAVLLGAGAAVSHNLGPFTRALLAGLVLSGAYFLIFLINPSGIGFGDVKLALPLGMLFGWHGWLFVALGAFAGQLLAALYGTVLVLSRHAGRSTRIALGPFMITGGFVGILLGSWA
ncbi:A24 family peptidase [Streptomyces sp. N35]|uniref:A24 family peptidase n=1 Tax=Streptomyces sp. N35 TaxID=2795730 RepID=UPI0027DDFC42|nr:A24 family peptidase [Streptomyces sp. N35]